MSETKKKATRKRTPRLCPVHTGSIHGGEAEELRAGVEKLIEEVGRAEVPCSSLQRLLDRVDARDSLAHLERQDAVHLTTAAMSLNDSEAAGLAQIRTGVVTSTAQADAADRWIDRVLAARRGEPDMANHDLAMKECPTCLGVGRIRDGETNALRRCLDCGGDGMQPVNP